MITKKDPHGNTEKVCDACKKNVMADQFGQGECEHCGWYQNDMGCEFPDRVVFPNIVTLNKAKLLVKAGKPLLPDFEDFMGGLFFYGEMEFDFEGRTFEISLVSDDSENITIGDSPTNIQTYKDREDFMANAHINGMLLKDIWHKVENAKYL